MLTELSSVFTEADNTIVQTGIADEKKKNKRWMQVIMDQAEEYLKSRRGEASSITSFVRSKMGRLQLDEIHNMGMEKKEAACVQKVKKLVPTIASLEYEYQMGLKKLDREIETENAPQLTLQQTICDVSRDNDRTANTESIELPWEICRIEEQIQVNKFLFKKERKRTSNDIWREFKKVSLPVFDSDKWQYEDWKSAFTACIDHATDHAPAIPQYKLLQLRLYLRGNALQSIEGLWYSGYVYQGAKEHLERKYEESDRKFCFKYMSWKILNQYKMRLQKRLRILQIC